VKEYWVAIIAVVINAAAQVSMKLAGSATESATGLAKWFSPWLLVSLGFYGVSFLLVARVVAMNPLSVAAPAMAGGTFILITLVSWLILGEGFNYQKLFGILFIFVGIILITRSS
jgi:multidrug transporter EmrE-like cation transporter